MEREPMAEYTPGRSAASFVIRLHGNEIPLPVEQMKDFLPTLKMLFRIMTLKQADVLDSSDPAKLKIRLDTGSEVWIGRRCVVYLVLED